MRSLQPRLAWAQVVIAASLLVFSACSSPPTSATSGPSGVSTASVAINHVDHHYIDAAAFQRISEAFTGTENKGGRVIERTDPAQRAGYYFIVDLAWHPGTTLPVGTQAVLEYVRNDSPLPKKELFTFSTDTGTWSEVLLGLTGAKWADQNFSIVAYKLTLQDAAGKVLATHQSFLWGLPEDTAPTSASGPVTSNP